MGVVAGGSRYGETQGVNLRMEGGVGGGCSFVACLSHLTIETEHRSYS